MDPSRRGFQIPKNQESTREGYGETLSLACVLAAAVPVGGRSDPACLSLMVGRGCYFWGGWDSHAR